jgi:hypothetical protein
MSENRTPPNNNPPPETEEARQAREAAEKAAAEKEERRVAAQAAFEGAPKLKLARDSLAVVSKEEERPYKRPPTVEGRVHAGMDAVIFLPSLEEQKKGFTPYVLDDEGNKVEAVRLLMQNFPAVYVVVTKKGE